MAKILDIVDMQNSFLKKDGVLSIKNADILIQKTNDFFDIIPVNFFDSILIKQDTHFKEEYLTSDESKLFPLHCEYKSYDWQLSVDISKLKNKSKIYKMSKNKFNMFEHSENNISNLFKIINYENDKVEFENIDDFLNIYKNLEVYIFGVASDFCVKDAIQGYISRGYKVFVLKDLTMGINKNILEVIQDEFKNSNKITVVDGLKSCLN